MPDGMDRDKILSKPVGSYRGSYDLAARRDVYAVRRHIMRLSRKKVFQILVVCLGQLMWINVNEGEVTIF